MQALARCFAPQTLARRLPALALSLLVAELFYRFGSFAVECLAFLLTWLVLDGIVAALSGVETADRPPGS